MTRHEKQLAALTTAVKKAKNPVKLKEKIKSIKQKKSFNDWLSQ